jgi:spermidine/putrescine transport system permease protein
LSIGLTYEEAATDLGATPLQAVRLALLPLLYPAIFASAIIVFALSLDDFVLTQYLSSNASSTSVPMLIYGAARTASTPALNAVAALMVITTALVAGLGGVVYRYWTRNEPWAARRQPPHGPGTGGA